MLEEKITVTKSYLETIIQERDFYKKVVDQIPAVVHINNLETQLVEYVNATAEKISGYAPSEMINNKEFLNSVVVVDDVDYISASLLDYKNLDKGIYSSIYSLKHKNGVVATYHNFGVCFEKNAEGKPIKNLCIDIDITHEVRNLKQLKKHLSSITQRLNEVRLSKLTKTEFEIVNHLVLGLSIKEIAELLNRSYHTIDNHRKNIYKKLEVKKIGELLSLFNDVGLKK